MLKHRATYSLDRNNSLLDPKLKSSRELEIFIKYEDDPNPRRSLEVGRISVDSSTSGVISDRSSVTMTTSLSQQGFTDSTGYNSVHWRDPLVHSYFQEDVDCITSSSIPPRCHQPFSTSPLELDYGPVHPYMMNSADVHSQPSHSFRKSGFMSHQPSHSCSSQNMIVSSTDSLPSTSSTSTNSKKDYRHSINLRYNYSEANSLFQHIPVAILIRIFAYLAPHERCSVTRVCKRWYSAAWSPGLWSRIHFSRSALTSLNINTALRTVTKILSYSTYPICSGVRRLILCGCQELSDRGLLTVVRRCPQLRYLDIRDCRLVTNRSLFEVISKLSHLEVLSASGCPLISTLSSCIPSNSSNTPTSPLWSLDLSNSPQLNDRGLNIVAGYCPRLTNLYLRRCPRLGDQGIIRIARCCRYLREISLSDCSGLTDIGVSELSTRLAHSLRYLSVTKCVLITDSGISKMAASCSRLRYLNLRGCYHISDFSLDSLAISSAADQLRSLDLGGCDVSDDGLEALGRTCSQLRRVNLSGCDAVTDTGLIALARGNPLLELINVMGCSVTQLGYRQVGQMAPHCIIEHNKLNIS